LIVDKTRENILRWFGHVMKREEMKAASAVMRLNFDVRRGKLKRDGWL